MRSWTINWASGRFAQDEYRNCWHHLKKKENKDSFGNVYLNLLWDYSIEIDIRKITGKMLYHTTYNYVTDINAFSQIRENNDASWNFVKRPFIFTCTQCVFSSVHNAILIENILIFSINLLLIPHFLNWKEHHIMFLYSFIWL